MLRSLIRVTRGPRYAFHRWSYQRAEGPARLEQLKDAYADRPMLIVGNGPSLNKTPLDEFAGVASIGMNKIDLIYDRTSWRPSLVMCTNNLVAAQHHDEWRRAGVPVYTSWKCRSSIGRKDRDHFSYFLSLTTREFSRDIRNGVGSAGTVTYAALQFAYYMGANPVIIVGVDHSFAQADAKKENVIERRKGADADHFDPNYFAAGQLWGVPNLSLSEYGYQKAREAFEEDGRQVLDATVDGKLTIFDKVPIESATELATGNATRR